MARPYSWEQLAGQTLRRQFPLVRGRGELEVVEVVRRTGPVQSQAARATFLSLAARLPGVAHGVVTAAHDSGALLRSTSLRGTVHTSSHDQHAALQGVSSRAQAALWRRTLKLTQAELDDFWAALEDLTRDDGLTHDDIEVRMREWFVARGLRESTAAIANGAGRFAFRSHAAMLRRPVSGGWEGQGGVAYRSARYARGEERVEPQRALGELVRQHVAASGPVSRRDLAWWSGDGLRNVDAAVEALADELVVRLGPDGQDYLDLADAPSRSSADPGVRLLPEYDALLLAYDPKARDRFADADAVSYTWNRRNGVHSPTVLVDGRLRGRWQLERKGGSATIAVEMFPGERLPDPGDLADPAAALAAVLGIPVTDVSVSRL